MNQMATATDDNGNLILDGQMIVVGSWDIANKKTAALVIELVQFVQLM